MQVCLPALLCMSLQWLLYALQVILNVNLPELVWDFYNSQGLVTYNDILKIHRIITIKKIF